jgi:hypothetical protein
MSKSVRSNNPEGMAGFKKRNVMRINSEGMTQHENHDTPSGFGAKRHHNQNHCTPSEFWERFISRLKNGVAHPFRVRKNINSYTADIEIASPPKTRSGGSQRHFRKLIIYRPLAAPGVFESSVTEK